MRIIEVFSSRDELLKDVYMEGVGGWIGKGEDDVIIILIKTKTNLPLLAPIALFSAFFLADLWILLFHLLHL